MTVRKKIDFITNILHSECKPLGFRRKARTWNRVKGRLTHVINLQASRWNEPEEGSFTLNVGVFIPSVHIACYPTPLPRFVNEVDCAVRVRVWDLVAMADSTLAKKNSFWWDLDLSTEVDLLGREVIEAVKKWGLPFLDGFESAEDIRDFLIMDLTKKKGKDFITELYLAVVYADLGNIEEAKRSLNELTQRYPKDPRAERVLAFVQRKAATSRC